jgi:pimeloyl-ACP methyl ester carboxylesterase
MLAETPFSVAGPTGESLFGDLRYSVRDEVRPLILICHGFNTHKDWGPFPYIGKALAEGGFCTIVFNFSHNGVKGGNLFFSDYARFSRNTPGKELTDACTILDAVASGEIGRGVIDPERIGMAGHSRGAGICLLAAREDKRVRAVVGWSVVGEFLRFSEEERTKWQESGYYRLRYGSSQTLLRYDLSVLQDLEKNAGRYDLKKAGGELGVPALLIHGADDTIVKPGEARSVYDRMDRSRSSFVLLENTGHTYGTEHPFKGTTSSLERLLALTKEWFNTAFQRENI